MEIMIHQSAQAGPMPQMAPFAGPLFLLFAESFLQMEGRAILWFMSMPIMLLARYYRLGKISEQSSESGGTTLSRRALRANFSFVHLGLFMTIVFTNCHRAECRTRMWSALDNTYSFRKGVDMELMLAVQMIEHILQLVLAFYALDALEFINNISHHKRRACHRDLGRILRMASSIQDSCMKNCDQKKYCEGCGQKQAH
jgi:hypothetical protein